jgi:hypothetical protein
MKYVVAIVFVGILGALALAGVFMMRDGRSGEPKSGNMMRALALRVLLSVLLFGFILLSYWLGWIHPTGIPLGK